MQRLPQIRQCLWWTRDDQTLDLALADQFFESSGHRAGEAMLLQRMPVRLLHGASTAADARKGAPWLVGALLVGRRIGIGKDTLDPQVGKLFIAVIAQKEGLAAVADQHQSIMGQPKRGHEIYLLQSLNLVLASEKHV